MPVVSGEYLYLHITEENGKDNPKGQGTDITINDTGERGSDRKRDDLNDDAWTAPIWFTHNTPPPQGTPSFTWSKNSNLYHDNNCWAVRHIGQANKRTGPAPTGKTKHNCRPAN